MKYNPNNPFMQFMARVADVMILNMTFIICCIPIFTIGAATTALYYTTMKMAKNKAGLIVAPFFRSFKQNFKQTTVCWIASLLLYAIFYLDFYLLNQMEVSAMTVALKTGLFIIFVLLLFELQILFPFIARFETTILRAVKSSAILALANLPRSVLMAAINIGAFFFTFLNSITLSTGIIAWILCGFAVIALINSFIINKIFNLFSPEDSETSDEIDDQDNN